MLKLLKQLKISQGGTDRVGCYQCVFNLFFERVSGVWENTRLLVPFCEISHLKLLLGWKQVTFVLPGTTGLERLFNSSGCMTIYIERVSLVSGRDERGGVFNSKCRLICRSPRRV